MQNFKSLRRFIHDTHGAEIAEAAAVLPLMFMILLGIFWFGQAFSIYGVITRAAQEGARAAALPYCATCTGSTTAVNNAVTTVQNTLSTANLDPTRARPPVTTPFFSACGNSSGGSASCSSPSTNMCVQTPVQLSNTSSGATGVCGVSVSFRYPFQFWLPFTSLNNQQVWMTASARVRLENQ